MYDRIGVIWRIFHILIDNLGTMAAIELNFGMVASSLIILLHLPKIPPHPISSRGRVSMHVDYIQKSPFSALGFL